jgi:hypothetical protein
VISSLLFAPSSSSIRFYSLNVAVFAAAALIFYRLFPKFLMQNVDGANLYVVLDKLNLWRASLWENWTITPLQSMTSTLWFPLTPILIPPFASFAITADPTLRVYLLAILASLSVFVSSLFFYRAIGFRRSFSVAAAWISFMLIMLQDTNLLQGTNNVQVMAWAYVCLALLAHIGRRTLRTAGLPLVVFQLGCVAYALGDPVWHLTTLPIFGLGALVILVGASSASARWLQSASLALAGLIQVGLRTYQSLFFTLADTARSVLPGEYGDVSRAASSAGFLFRPDTIELAVGLLLIFGLAAGHLEPMSRRPLQARLLEKGAPIFYVGAALAGLVYLYRADSPAFRVGYVAEMSYPLAALFITAAIWRLGGLARGVPSAASLWQRAGGLCLIAFAVWHIQTNSATLQRFGEIGLGLAGVLLLVRFGWLRTATLAGGASAIVALHMHIDASYGAGGDPEFDGSRRMGLTDNVLVRRLADETAIQPGAVFRGYVEDVYQRRPTAPNVGDELVLHWRDNLDHYGSGQTLFSWSAFDIPTIGEYDPFIRPLYYLFFTRLLDDPADHQLDNYLGATRLNSKIMQLMGVRFVVTDRADMAGLQEWLRWDGLRVLETPSPNLASYSPVEVVHATTAGDILDTLASDRFDPHTQLIVDGGQELPSLVEAPPAELRFERGGYRVIATSPEWSLIVLPIQYSHCFAITASSSPDARLVRVNLVQTGLLYRGSTVIEVRHQHWPLASPECQRQDYADTGALHARDLQR